ncbi:MAG: DUF1761 domain-containing protein [Ignavibacteriae bacterium]|nr:DUF1761 domain-containing protein [Ignavibacteriota bacterium]
METIFAQVNLLAVLVSSVAYFILGAAWYSPVLFAKPWMNALGKKEEDFQSSPLNFIATFIAIFITVYVLGIFIVLTSANALLPGAFVGAVAGIGFVLTSCGINSIYDGRPVKLVLITSGYHILGLTVSGIILGIWN